MLRNLIMSWLHLNKIKVDTTIACMYLRDQAVTLQEIKDELLALRSDLAVAFGDEHDPKRKAMSDKLGQRMVQKLSAEDKARKHTLGEL